MDQLSFSNISINSSFQRSARIDNKISKGGASIPQSFTKILDYRKPNGIFAREVYCFPNDASVYKKNIESYKVKELSFERDEFEELF